MTSNSADPPLAMDDSRYRLLVEAVTDYAIYMLDPNGVVASWNPGAQRYKGYNPHEIIGKNFALFYSEADRLKGIPQCNLEIAAREGRYEDEGWRLRKDGTRFWAHVVIDPIRQRDGALIGFAKITRDLTERMETRDALRLREERFRLLVQGVTDYAIYMLDENGFVTNWNAGAERIKGYAAEEIIGSHFSRFYIEEDRRAGEPEQALRTAVEEGRFEKEGQRLRKDGTRFWANVIIDPIRNEDGRIIGFAKVTRDVTEKRETQKALESTREALFQSQKIEAVGQLTGGIARDFNNVLMAIMSSLELMRKRLPPDAKLLTLLENAVQGAKRGAALTKRMLAFARRQELNLTAVDIPTLVRGMTDLLQRSLGPAFGIETRFPLSLKAVLSDANQLELAILNLAVNARDAMPNGGPLIIAAREEKVGLNHASRLPEGDYICLSVSDAGTGMDEATLTRAMEPFFTTKGAGKGTGLGLSMVHGVTEQSGGRLILKSARGQGTTAEMWLPVAKTAPEAKTIPQAAPARDTSGARLKILAVDDDALVLMNTEAMLDDLNHTVLIASTGARALEILRTKKDIDLVITDQAMPEMAGHELVEAIKQQWPNMLIILASGYAQLPEGTTTTMYRLSKPFGQPELARVIADAMAGKRAAREQDTRLIACP